MNVKIFKPAGITLLVSVLFFVIHSLVFHFFKIPTAHFYHSLSLLYGFFATASFVIIIVLILVDLKNRDYVGYAFMLLTCIKMAVSYLILHPILQTNDKAQKINFFIVFMLFLAIETVVTIRILNNKQ